MSENNHLPSSWVFSTLGNVCSQPQYGYTTKATNDGDLHLLRTTDITSGQIDWNTVPFCTQNPDDVNKYLLESGDVVISRAGSVGYSYLLDKPERAVFASYLIRFKPFIDKKLFKYFLQSPNYWNEISETKLGIAVPNVNATKLKAIEIPIPPLNEQKRIVAKIEELFGELDAGVASLQLAQAQLKTYRQALLKHAFEGQLTADWRETNADKLEPAETLLQRIQAERQARHQAELADWKAEVKTWEANGKPGKKPRKPRPLKDLPPLTPSELEDLPELPAGWAWGKLGWMTCGVEYGTSAKSSENGTHPVLRMGNIQNAKFDWSDLVYTSEPDEIEKYLLREDDVLFNRTNSPEWVGKTAIYKAARPAIFAGYLIRVNQIKSVINSQYLNLFLNSPVAKNQGNRVKTDGVNQSNINGEKLSNYPFPFCSLAEQNEIINQLEMKLSVVDDFGQEVSDNLVRAEALRQSILKKAFAGQLVPQDPHDEPASILLARIQAAKS